MRTAHSHTELHFELTPMRPEFLRFAGLHRTHERGRRRHQVMKLVAASIKKARNK